MLKNCQIFSKCNVCFFFCSVFWKLKRKRRKKKKEKHCISQGSEKSFHLNFWFNTIIIKVLMHCVHVLLENNNNNNNNNKQIIKQTNKLYCVEFRSWCVFCLAPSFTTFFSNYLITESWIMRYKCFVEFIHRMKKITFA